MRPSRFRRARKRLKLTVFYMVRSPKLRNLVLGFLTTTIINHDILEVYILHLTALPRRQRNKLKNRILGVQISLYICLVMYVIYIFLIAKHIESLFKDATVRVTD